MVSRGAITVIAVPSGRIVPRSVRGPQRVESPAFWMSKLYHPPTSGGFLCGLRGWEEASKNQLGVGRRCGINNPLADKPFSDGKSITFASP